MQQNDTLMMFHCESCAIKNRCGFARNALVSCQCDAFFSYFRAPVSTSESPRLAKTLTSTASPIISKSYYSDPDQSYPYYTIYDDDVSIYKDDGRQNINKVIYEELKN